MIDRSSVMPKGPLQIPYFYRLLEPLLFTRISRPSTCISLHGIFDELAWMRSDRYGTQCS